MDHSRISMEISDWVILYLSFGAPAGVLMLFAAKGRIGVRHPFICAAAWLTWPVSLALVLGDGSLRRKALGHAGSDPAGVDASDIKSQSRRLETVASPRLDPSGAIRFREALECYAALSVSLLPSRETGNVQEIHDFFGTSGSKAPVLGTLCLMRRNRRRLAFHRAKVRLELFEILDVVSGPGPRRLAHEQLGRLFSACGDGEGEELLRRRADGRSNAPRTRPEPARYETA